MQTRAHGRPFAASMHGDIVRFAAPQPRVAPGQVVACYDGDLVLGGGIAASLTGARRQAIASRRVATVRTNSSARTVEIRMISASCNSASCRPRRRANDCGSRSDNTIVPAGVPSRRSSGAICVSSSDAPHAGDLLASHQHRVHQCQWIDDDQACGNEHEPSPRERVQRPREHANATAKPTIVTGIPAT